MINLLPYKTRDNLKLAKSNTSLIKYITVLLLISAFIGIYFFNMKVQINNIEKSSAAQVTQEMKQDSERINKEKAAMAESTSIKQALASSKTAISHTSYYKFISLLANSLPKGAVIKDLSISDKTLSSPLQLKVYATSPNVIASLKESFGRNDKVFTNVTIESVSNENDESSDIPSKYSTAASIILNVNTGGLE